MMQTSIQIEQRGLGVAQGQMGATKEPKELVSQCFQEVWNIDSKVGRWSLYRNKPLFLVMLVYPVNLFFNQKKTIVFLNRLNICLFGMS